MRIRRILSNCALLGTVLFAGNEAMAEGKVRLKTEKDDDSGKRAYGLSWEYEYRANPGNEDQPIHLYSKGTILDREELNEDGLEFGGKWQLFSDLPLIEATTDSKKRISYSGRAVSNLGLEAKYAATQEFKDEQYLASAFAAFDFGHFKMKPEEVWTTAQKDGDQIDLPALVLYYDWVRDNEDTLGVGLPFSERDYGRFRTEVHWKYDWGKGNKYLLECRYQYFKEYQRGQAWEQADLDDAHHYLIRLDRLVEWGVVDALYVEYNSGRQFSGNENRDKYIFGVRLRPGKK